MLRRISLAILLLCATAGADSLSSATQNADGIAEKRKLLAADDAEGRLLLARAARDAKQWDQMAELAREVFKIDPESRAAYDLLLIYDREVPIPLNSAAAEALKKDLSGRFRQEFNIWATAHFMIVYDTPNSFTRERGAYLEKAYQSFTFWFNMKRLRPELLKERLPVVLFKQRAHYLQYAKQVDGDELAWTAGYYSQRTNRATFYDDSTGDMAEQANDKVDEAKIRVRNLTIAIENARRSGNNQTAMQLSRERDSLNRSIQLFQNRVGNSINKINTLKTVHEAIHQLAFNTGIQKRLVDYPMWLAEGIACSFEADDSRGARGPGTINPYRLFVLRKIASDSGLLSWDQVIVGPGRNVEENAIEKYYAQSWLLFHYLYKFHRAELEEILVEYNEMPILKPVNHMKVFSDVIKLDTVELRDKIEKYAATLPSPRPF